MTNKTKALVEALKPFKDGYIIDFNPKNNTVALHHEDYLKICTALAAFEQPAEATLENKSKIKFVETGEKFVGQPADPVAKAYMSQKEYNTAIRTQVDDVALNVREMTVDELLDTVHMPLCVAEELAKLGTIRIKG